MNKWTSARTRPRGRSHAGRSDGRRPRGEPRYRDIFRPLGLGDELRAVLRVGGACWGYLCLHREAGAAFSQAGGALRAPARPAPCGGHPRRPAPLERRAQPTSPSARARGPGADGSCLDDRRRRALAGGARPPARRGSRRDPRARREARAAGRARAAPQAPAPHAGRTLGGAPRLAPADRGRGRGRRDHRGAVARRARAAADAGLRPHEPGAGGDHARLPRPLDARAVRRAAHHAEHAPGPSQVDLREDRREQPAELVATILREQYLPRAMAGQAVGASGFFAAPG